MKTISFDLDNTLVSSNKSHALAFQKAFEKYKLEKISQKNIVELLDGRFASQIVKALFPSFSDEEAEKIAKEHNKFIMETARYARKIDDAEKILLSLRKKFKIVLITNCTKKETRALLKGAGINERIFDNIITGNSLGKKTKPEEFKAGALKKIEADYHVGDSIYDIKAAKKAKAKAIAVLTGNVSKKRLEKERPFAIIKSISGLKKILRV